MEGLLFLAVLVVLILWGWVLVRFMNRFGSQGFFRFLFHVAGYIAIVIGLWYAIVYPQIPCDEMLCALMELLAWFALATLLGIIWPAIILIITPNKPVGHRLDDILDD